MAFEQVRYRPTSRQISHPEAAFGSDLLYVPPQHFFERERSDWLDIKATDPTLRSAVAPLLIDDLDRTLEFRDTIEAAAARPTLDQRTLMVVASWRAFALATMSMSRLFRELPIDTQDAEREELADAPEQASMVLDLHPAIGNAALHFSHEGAEEFGFEVPPRDSWVWYKGSDIFIELFRPATPSRLLIKDALAGKVRSFKEERVTIMPHLKKTFWETDRRTHAAKPRGRTRRRTAETPQPTLPLEFRIPKAIRNDFNQVNSQFVNGYTNTQFGWSIEGNTKENARIMTGILYRTAADLAQQADTDQETVLDRLATIPLPLLRKGLGELLYERDGTPKWNHVTQMLKDSWPTQSIPVDWAAVGEILQTAHDRLPKQG